MYMCVYMYVCVCMCVVYIIYIYMCVCCLCVVHVCIYVCMFYKSTCDLVCDYCVMKYFVFSGGVRLLFLYVYFSFS